MELVISCCFWFDKLPQFDVARFSYWELFTILLGSNSKTIGESVAFVGALLSSVPTVVQL